MFYVTRGGVYTNRWTLSVRLIF